MDVGSKEALRGHTLCIACGQRSELGKPFCGPCQEPLIRGGRGLAARLKANRKDAKGVVPVNYRKKRRHPRP